MMASPTVRRRVAVIGGGASGLVAGRELRRRDHHVIIFERGARVGGVWVHTPAVESDALGLDPGRKIIHSSLYASLRTNLPREIMGFFDYPFVYAAGSGAGDRRRFPGHREVLRYLEDFAREFDLYGLIKFGAEVVGVEMREGEWSVAWRGGATTSGEEEREAFDAVVICTGHYCQPRVAEIPGIEMWPGKQIHSHNYRVPEAFQDQVVCIIGYSASAVDISRDIAVYAKEVHISCRSLTVETPLQQSGYDNMWLHSMIESTQCDGTVTFKDGTSVYADVIMHCTGYKYHFPFLKTNEVVGVEDNRVGPLYKHVFPPSLAPYLSFIGLPFKVTPFPMFEMQSKWVASVLSGVIELPTQEEMMKEIRTFYSELELIGYPQRHTHNIGKNSFEYVNWLGSQCGHPQIVEEWRKKMYEENMRNYTIARPNNYRNEWEDDDLISQAHEDFKKILFSTRAKYISL